MKFFFGQKNNTSKKRLSAEVVPKASSRDLSSVLSHMNVGFMVIDKTGCISEINTACMNFLNISNAALAGKDKNPGFDGIGINFSIRY